MDNVNIVIGSLGTRLRWLLVMLVVLNLTRGLVRLGLK